jgi:hypothetical protein
MHCSWADVASNDVDIFDGTSRSWTTAALKVARSLLAATSLPNQGLAIFAGGRTTSAYITLFLHVDISDVEPASRC